MRRSAILATCFAILVALAAIPIKAEEETAQPKNVIGKWLVLGPVAQPTPAFADQDSCEASNDLLEINHLPTGILFPSPGDEVDCFGTNTSWNLVEAGSDGAIGLDATSGHEDGQPSVVWLATTVRNDRFSTLNLEIESEHPARFFLDDSEVESGDEIELARGTHQFLIQSVFDPEVTETWSIRTELSGEFAESIEVSIDQGRDLGILDVTDITTAAGIDLSPDGHRVVMSLTRVLPGTDQRESWIEIRSTIDGSLLRTLRGSSDISQVRFAPTGGMISYVSRNPNTKEYDVLVADQDLGSASILIRGVADFESYIWSPLGDLIVYSVETEAEQDERGIKRLRGLLDRMAGNRDLSSLYAASIPSGITRRLTSGDLSVGALAFSPDGTRLLVTREREDLSQRPYSVTELWELNLADGGARKLRDGRWIQDAAYSPDGKTIVVQAGPSEFGEAGIAVGLEAPVNDYDGQLFVFDPETDSVDAITRDFDPAVASFQWSVFDGAVYLLAADGHRRGLFQYSFEKKEFRPIDTGIESLESFAIAEEGATIVASGTSVWTPQRVIALDAEDEEPRLIVEPGAARFQGVRRGDVETWNFKASDGRLVNGRVYLPVGFEPGGQYPAIVNYYGGTSPMNRSFGGRYPAEWWAANGYVVYVLTPTGAYGWGQDESAVHVNDWGEVTSRQIIEATGAFLEAHPFVDPKRVGCIGASYGGFMTMSLVTKTDIFAAAVAHAGISALVVLGRGLLGIQLWGGGQRRQFSLEPEGHLCRAEPALQRRPGDDPGSADPR